MKKLFILAALLCVGCSTNIGRALGSAFSGTPPEVVEAVQFTNEKMSRELRMRYYAIERSYVTNPDGSVNRESAESRFNEMTLLNFEIEKWDELSRALAEYLGVGLREPLDASEKRADERRKELFRTLYKSAQEAIKEKIKEGSNE